MDTIDIWQARDNPRIQVVSDGEQFIAIIHAGMDWESILAVGYSCPNYALRYEDDFSIGYDRMVNLIKVALDKAYLEIYWKNDLKSETPNLLRLCEVANDVYNRWSIRSDK